MRHLLSWPSMGHGNAMLERSIPFGPLSCQGLHFFFFCSPSEAKPCLESQQTSELRCRAFCTRKVCSVSGYLTFLFAERGMTINRKGISEKKEIIGECFCGSFPHSPLQQALNPSLVNPAECLDQTLTGSLRTIPPSPPGSTESVWVCTFRHGPKQLLDWRP